ncbi:MAG: saccharopine dehydrogenase C-terminal domain-containing protein [Pseudomonadota bacterium]
MHDVLLLGAGKIGVAIAHLLSRSGDYRVTVADLDAANLKRIPKHPGIRTQRADVADGEALVKLMKGKFAALNACPFHLVPVIAKAARKAGAHYFDLTEDVAATRLVKALAKGAKSAFVPQCGLAPGFISIVAYDLAKRFERLHNVHMRVGALPQYPSNALKYNLTWSTDGLINEYCNPCEAIVDGALKEVPPLEEMEQFSLDGDNYEAFNTSGGLGTLCETLKDKVDNLNYRTVRYPGHRDIMKMLIRDLRLGERREMLKDIFEYALPITYQDVVLVFVTVSGYRAGQFVQESFARKVYARAIDGQLWSAIQITTASGMAAMVDLLAQGQLPQKGFVRQEDCDYADFIANRFGRNYSAECAKAIEVDRPAAA